MTSFLSRRRLLLAGAGSLSLSTLAPLTHAANGAGGYPQRALHPASPYPPGGTNVPCALKPNAGRAPCI